MVGRLAGDDLRLLGVAAQLVVRPRQLPGGLHGLGAARGEEHAVQVPRGERGDPVGQLDRARMGIAPVREEAELLGLRGGGLAELRAAVARVHAEQRRQPVEVALAVLVEDVATLAAHDDRDLVLLVVRTHAREMHPEVATGLLLQVARGARVRLVRGLGSGCHLLSSSSTGARRSGQRYRRIWRNTRANGVKPCAPTLDHSSNKRQRFSTHMPLVSAAGLPH